MRIANSILLLGVIAVPALAAPWETMTLEDLCQMESARIEKLFDSLDTSLPGLEPVEAATREKNWLRACRALLDYYEQRFKDHALAAPTTPSAPNVAAMAILSRKFTFYRVTDTVPQLAHGGLDWTCRGSGNDREWAWGLNRHSHLGQLLNAYAKSGEDRFVATIDRHLRDWVLHSPYPGKKTNDAQWRGLETALRMNTWPSLFRGLQGHPDFTPPARILMLSALPNHAHYNRNFHARGNWLTMEMNGLATVAMVWPEFKGSRQWLEYATTQMTRDMSRQVYPDGIQTELTSHYHWVALLNFEKFMLHLASSGAALPEVYRETVEKMWNYLAYSMRPSGYGLLNNDSDYNFTRGQVLPAADRYARPDWRYIATNGAQGATPDEGPSIFFPWAGETIMRSGWDVGADWAFFDVGPLGTGHTHRDKLHLSIHADGRDLLVDSGRYTYVGGPWRHYFVGTRAHNTLLIDDCEQKNYTAKSEAAIENAFVSTKEYDFAQGVFAGGYNQLKGTATHKRAVVYLRNQYWLVFDHIDSDRPRAITALWQFHPDCTVQQAENSVFTTDRDKGNILVSALAADNWAIDLISGQEDPVQGWYSEQYNIKTPATTARFSRNAGANTAMAWLLLPLKNKAAGLDAVTAVVEQLDHEQARVQVEIDGIRQQIAVDFGKLSVSISKQ
jgi:heparinase II/III-like protein